MEETVLTKFRLPLKYDPNGQMIFDQDNEHVADIRGWGHLQYYPEGAELQDTLGEMMVKAFNEKYQPSV